MGQMDGAETVTLTLDQLPQHQHQFVASDQIGNQASPSGHVLARSNSLDAFANRPAEVALDARSVTSVGGGQPHDNVQPSLSISFIIALFGVYPQQT